MPGSMRMFNPAEYHLIRRAAKTPVDKGWPALSNQQYNDHRANAGEVGIVNGVLGGIYVVDIDDVEEATLVLLHWDLPATLLVETSPNHFHYFFRYSGKLELRRMTRPYPGIDLLGLRGYTALHEPLDRYNPDHIAEMPEVLLNAWVEAMGADSEPREISQALPGNRNDTMFSLAGLMRRQGMPAAQIEKELQQGNAALPHPLPQREITQISASVARYDQDKVRQIDDGQLLLPIETFLDMCLRGDAMLTPEPIIGQFMTGTWGIIAGAPGVGKSIIAAQLARAIAQGTAFCDWMPDKPRRVALIDAEMTPLELRDRIGSGDIPNLYVSTLDLMERKGRECFGLGGDQCDQTALMRVCKNFDVIIIDNIEYTLEPAPGKDIWHPESWKLVHPLLSWAKASNKLLILIDHTNAQGGVQGGLSKQRGASFIITLARSWVEDALHAFEWIPGKCRYQTSRENLAKREFWIDPDGAWHSEVVANMADQIRELVAEGKDLAEIRKEMKGICSADYCRKIVKRSGRSIR